ncbi:hypothetical protein PT279_06930 [Bifidobacterium sp. ESL0784]|uniref:hypothetical protein n=1 Tax=Bifidobacterium sp. ESL0784 TaxID=2983231 RepID=UPI0023F9354F|nr:hypothetical protein [Bifidobacterium sp. ESL0784]MDF7641317.1 hypothetical protein [Bifidobacterium sp. ESL0784]
MEEILGKVIDSLPKQFQFVVTLIVIIILLSCFIIKEFGINPSFFNSSKRLKRKIQYIDSLSSVLDVSRDGKILEKRKVYFQNRLEIKQFQKQFKEYARGRLEEDNPEIGKLFKPKKFFAFIFYAIFVFIYAFLLVFVILFFVYGKKSAASGFSQNKLLGLLEVSIIFIIGIFLCIGIQKLWKEMQINFVFQTYLLPLLHTEGGFAINHEESAFNKMIEIRRSNAPKISFLAPLFGGLLGCSIPCYVLCMDLLKLLPNNSVLLILSIIFMSLWFVGLLYFCFSFGIFVFRKIDAAY